MPVADSNFPSSQAFDVINDALQSSEAERADAVNDAQVIIAFTLTNASGAEQSWYLDFKNKGEVGKGAAPEGGKADVTLQLTDEDFGSLVSGSANAQRLFMGGKLKIRGNMMKAMKVEPILKKAQTKAKL